VTARAALEAAGRVRFDTPLGPLTTYKIGGPARALVEAEDEEDVLLAARMAVEEGLPVLPLGRGSNVVIAESGFRGVVIRAAAGLSKIAIRPDGLVDAGGGCPLPLLARDTARAGRGGLEFYAGIPGTVGGAVRMNAGGHGSDTAACLRSARIVDLAAGSVEERAAADLDLGYRHSNLDDTDFVVGGVFTTTPSDPDEALARIRELTRWRRRHQPGGTLNAGSVFKNPPGDHAGRIIDSLGLKGLAIGAVRVSERHANFFVADAGATPGDLHALVEEVRRRVKEATGVELHPEVRFVGDFT
jgi:UDP-N-acetylmuramate dehydrogenase